MTQHNYAQNIHRNRRNTMTSEPIMPKAHDGIYPRCVWCRGENYALAVIAYSTGEIPCAAVNGCGRYLPDDYRTRRKETASDE